MNGLLLSERYYKFFGKPMIEKNFPDFENRIAVGLVGEGSECFGFDDEYSTDHDWGPGFCIWLNEQDFTDIGNELQSAYNDLPKEFAGITTSRTTYQAGKRIGVFEINDFYEKFIGLPEPPSSWEEWIEIKEKNLAACTNGKIFCDSFGEFSCFRKKLLNFYPSDIRLKKIADRCFTISREGQYNFMRCARRKEFVAATLAESKFIEAVISMTFLINWNYTPYYKWMHKALLNLPILGIQIFELLQRLSSVKVCTSEIEFYNKKLELIDIICSYLSEELNRQQISNVKSNFLLDHSTKVLCNIENEDIKNFRFDEN